MSVEGWIILAAILAVILIGVSGYLTALKRQLRKAEEELKRNGEYSYNKQLSVSLFDRDLTSLAAELNRSLEYQKQLKLEAERSQRQLKQSVSDIAHDLRTPVTVIKGNLQRLQMEPELTEKSREYLKICCDKTDALTEMINDFFELSFLESETMEAQLFRLDLTDFVAQFLVDHEALIREKGLEPEIQIPEKSIFIQADEQLLTRIFGNLLGNILKHTTRNFSIGIWEEEERIRICFSNPLEGGERPDPAHIFDRTYRGDRARTGGGSGGLGLYIVKLLTEKQHGEVCAKCGPDTLTVELLFPREGSEE